MCDGVVVVVLLSLFPEARRPHAVSEREYRRTGAAVHSARERALLGLYSAHGVWGASASEVTATRRRTPTASATADVTGQGAVQVARGVLVTATISRLAPHSPCKPSRAAGRWTPIPARPGDCTTLAGDGNDCVFRSARRRSRRIACSSRRIPARGTVRRARRCRYVLSGARECAQPRRHVHRDAVDLDGARTCRYRLAACVGGLVGRSVRPRRAEHRLDAAGQPDRCRRDRHQGREPQRGVHRHELRRRRVRNPDVRRLDRDHEQRRTRASPRASGAIAGITTGGNCANQLKLFCAEDRKTSGARAHAVAVRTLRVHDSR